MFLPVRGNCKWNKLSPANKGRETGTGGGEKIKNAVEHPTAVMDFVLFIKVLQVAMWQRRPLRRSKKEKKEDLCGKTCLAGIRDTRRGGDACCKLFPGPISSSDPKEALSS